MKKELINPNSETPIFQQIIDEIERQVLVGELKEGEFLTSVREFAVKATVNPNTVARAYRSLQAMGLVESVRGKGLAVLRPSKNEVDSRKTEILEEKVSELVDVSTSLNINLNDLISLIKSSWRTK